MLLTERRLLGLDSHVLQLNWNIFDSDARREWPSPNRVVVYIRYAVRLPKAAVRSLLRRVKQCRASDTGEEKTAEKALEEYRQTLQNTFGSSETINDIMRDLEWWIDGL